MEGFARAMVKTTNPEEAEGASTIKCVSKNRLMNGKLQLERKIKELWRAIQLRKLQSKDKIFEIIFKYNLYRENAYGVKQLPILTLIRYNKNKLHSLKPQVSWYYSKASLLRSIHKRWY